MAAPRPRKIAVDAAVPRLIIATWLHVYSVSPEKTRPDTMPTFRPASRKAPRSLSRSSHLALVVDVAGGGVQIEPHSMKPVAAPQKPPVCKSSESPMVESTGPAASAEIVRPTALPPSVHHSVFSVSESDAM